MQAINPKYIVKKRRASAVLAFVLAISLLFQFAAPVSFADAPQSYGRSYGLLVHNGNADKTVPKLKALQILLNFFPDVNAPLDLSDSKQVCKLAFLKCEINFYPYKPISQKEFLIWFHQLSLMNSKKMISDEDEQTLYRRLWLEARQNNWLKGNTITYKTLHEFLYRYEVSRKFLDIPYAEGIVLDISEIDPQNFSVLNDLVTYESNVFEQMLRLKAIEKRTKNEEWMLQELTDYYQVFKALEAKLKEMNLPVNVIPDLPGYVADNIKNNGMDEVLAKISYDYSKNNANRKHNLIAGLSKISGKVWMPDQVMDIMEVLGEGGWWDYKMGWVIIGGAEEWQFGGGLCGVATMIFTPSWLSGLQIIKRYPHSLFYSSLYPTESLGLDATIYRGTHKNLKIRNNTGGPIMYYVYDDKDKQIVTVYLLGNSPYSKVSIEGPIKINRTTYKWIRHMQSPDGTMNTEELVTKYGAVY